MDNDHFNEQMDLITESVCEGKTRFFIGAGVPKVEAKLPLFNELAIILVKAFHHQYPELSWCAGLQEDDAHLLDGVLPEQIAELCLAKDKILVKQTIYECLSTAVPMGPSYDAIQALANYMKAPLTTIYTTNFDKTIETFLGARAVSIATAEDWKTKSERPGVKVVHLNGYIEVGNYKISESDLYNVDLLTDPLYRNVVEALSENSLVFVGYGLRDPGINLIFSIASTIIGQKHPHFAVCPSKFLDNQNPARAEAKWNFLSSLWDNRKVRLLNTEPGLFFKALIQKVHSNEYDSAITHIEKKGRKNLTKNDIMEFAQRIANQSTISDQETVITFLEHLL